MSSVFLTLIAVSFINNFISAGVVRDSDLYRLDIVHYNDFHDRFEETSIKYPDCKTNNTRCLGGFARLFHEIMTLLKEKPDALLLNAGDVFQGTYWYTLLKWNVTQKFINLLPNDAHTIGNHEFDDGVEGLKPYLEGLRAPVVVANIDTSLEPSLNGLYVPHIIIEKKGKKIGIIGVMTVETRTSSRPRNVKFLDPIKTVLDESQILTDQGIDIIIVLSHCGLEIDKKIAKTVGENVDIIVGGHSHSLLWNGESPSKEEISGPYPVLVESKSKPGHKVIVVTAAAFSKYLGNITTYFDKQGELVSYDGEPVFLNRSIPEDPEIKAMLQPYANELHAVVQEVIGHADQNLLASSCGSKECAIGDLIADAFLNATKEANVSDLPHVAFIIRSMIRGSIEGGDITRGSIINTMPFTNDVVTFVLQGKYLIETMQFCLGTAWRNDPFMAPRMPQIAGFQMTLNTTSKKVESIHRKRDDNHLVPINEDDDFQVTTLDFIANGGSGFEILKKHSRNKKSIGVDRKMFEAYVRKLAQVNDTLDYRLTVVK